MRRILAVCAGIVGGAIPVLAQSAVEVPPPSNPVASSITASSSGAVVAAAGTVAPGRYGDSVLVTATLEEERTADVPATVSVLDSEDLAARKNDDALDLLRSEPGLFGVRLGSPGKQGALFSRGTNSNHTLVLWNGIELNDPYAGGFDWGLLDVLAVERIEVVRGPFSALYGSDALGGVVQLITQRAGSGGRLAAELGSKSFHRIAGNGDFAGERFRADLAASTRRGRGELPNDFYDADQGLASLEARSAGGARVGLFVRDLKTTIGLPFDFFGAPSPERRQRADSREIALPADFVASGFDADFLASTTSDELRLIDPNDPFSASDSRARRDAARAHAGGALGDDVRFDGGFDWKRDRATTSSAFGGVDDVRATDRAAFAQASWRPAGFRVDAGLRRDASGTFGGATTARVAAAATLGAEWRLRAAFGQGFHAPTLADLYFPGFGNPHLRPERSNASELGLDWSRGRWRASLVGFDNELSNLIQFDFARSLPFNTGRARTRGLETDLSAHWPLVTLRANATRLDAKDLETGAPLVRRPRWQENLLVTATPGRLGLAATLRFVGARIDVGGVPLDSYRELDLAASVRFARGPEVSLRLDNAANARYVEAVGYPASRRRIVLGASWSL